MPSPQPPRYISTYAHIQEFERRQQQQMMWVDTRTYMTCAVCRRTLRIGMFIDARTHQLTGECRCCKYQAALAERPGNNGAATKMRSRWSLCGYWKRL